MFAYFTFQKTELLLNQDPNCKFARMGLWGSQKKTQTAPSELLEIGVLLWQKAEEIFQQMVTAESWGSTWEAAW